ncbi:hypothetical protein ASZ90_006173 [hydrocarbon metagenome]|uniref:Uncharacterized protein n=1 Tax=hydrocarbon metagenome TaxID=938273 RepID=A0A0W8FTC4_9ZZZZ
MLFFLIIFLFFLKFSPVNVLGLVQLITSPIKAIKISPEKHTEHKVKSALLYKKDPLCY